MSTNQKELSLDYSKTLLLIVKATISYDNCSITHATYTSTEMHSKLVDKILNLSSSDIMFAHKTNYSLMMARTRKGSCELTAM